MNEPKIVSVEYVEVDTYCKDCKGTGAFRHAWTPKGVGYVCQTCKGTGKFPARIEKFVGRKTRTDVLTVRMPAPHIEVKEGEEYPTPPDGPVITYEEFVQGHLPGEGF